MNAYCAYNRVNVATASPQRVMMSLFEAALRHIRQSRTAFAAGDYRNGIESAERAANIVLGLQATLKHDVHPELCERLDALYGFVVGRLTLACGCTSATYAEEAERVLLPLAEAFGEALAQESAAPPLAVAAGGR